jgi:hypothetical protein
MVLGSADGPSPLTTSMFTVEELFEGWINAAAANGVYWGSRTTLVTTMSHFLELKTVLEVLWSRRSANLTEDESDVLWNQVRMASDSLVSHVLSLVARNPPDSTGE